MLAQELIPSDGFDQGQLVYVVDDNIDIRRSLHFLLSTAGLISWPFACAFDFLENLPNLKPAPILLDIRMPEIDGVDVMTELCNREIKWPVIVVTGFANIPVAVQAIKLGAIDLLEKPIDFEQLISSLDVAKRKLNGIMNAEDIRRDACSRFGLLSPREFEVLLFLLDGIPNKIAAHGLSLSVRTVEMHRANALLKLNVKSIAQVVQLARDAGITLTPRK